ncbi:hypothetical protein EUGRSUZ_I00011 [Eucalyptus grandis]|uniref:Uncharacterized protein n=2 Tax=Eucalyptus grandis TaxID=71139 RepID=A0ACC3JB15_EUCGR|nr:hypothetical protein EUGRSUZ_I00011 [Eucalyptus grandis]
MTNRSIQLLSAKEDHNCQRHSWVSTEAGLGPPTQKTHDHTIFNHQSTWICHMFLPFSSQVSERVDENPKITLLHL